MVESVGGGTTGITLATGFTDALATLELEPGVVGGAKLTDGSLVSPSRAATSASSRRAISPYVIGQLQHEGSGLTLRSGATTVRLSNLNVDPGASRVYGDVAVNGKTAATSAFLFQLDGRTLDPLKTKGNRAILEGTKVEISDVAAPLLDKTFGTKAVKPGLLVGIAKITVDTK